MAQAPQPEPPHWGALPPEIVQQLAACIADPGPDEYAEGKTLLRRVCRDWWQSLPIGQTLPANVWEWQPGMERSLAPHVRSLRVLSPQPDFPPCGPPPPGSPLPHLAACRRLRSLTLCHVAPRALDEVAGHLEALTALDVTVCWGTACRSWLDFATGLTHLQELSVRAALIRLQPECGLAALAPLAGTLRRLHLRDCVLVSDAGAARLEGLSGLTALELVPSAVGQAGLDRLAAGLRRLRQLSIRLQDGVDPQRLLGQPGLTAMALQMSRVKANDFIGVAWQVVPQARRLAVELSGGPSGFLMTAPFQGVQGLRHLESLSLVGVQLVAEVVAGMATCTSLQELTAELDWTVRSGAFRHWTTLRGLRCLSLRCNFYLRDADWQALLEGLPHLQNLSMESMHGSGAALHPLRGATALTRLRLAACHFESGALLGGALAGVVQPGGRGGAPGLKSLELEGCGVQSAVVAALTQALDGSGTQGSGGSSAIVVSPRERRALLLRELRVELKWRVGQNAGQALAHAVAQCTQLTALDLHFPALRDPQPTTPAWALLSSLTGLRTLHICSGLGLAAPALALVCGVSPRLRELTLTDNHGAVGDDWLDSLAPLSQLSRLELNSCRGLTEERAVPALAQLRALTSLRTYRCPGLTSVRVMEQLRAALPCLARVSLRE